MREWAQVLRQYDIIRFPYADILSHAAFTRLSFAALRPVYNEFLESPEYSELKGRPHLIYPKIVSLASEVRF